MRRLNQYIHQLLDWPKFHWKQEIIATPLAGVRHRQGRLLGRMDGLGFPQQNETVLQALTLDVIKSSEIEGEVLNTEQVRSSIARRLGMDIAGLTPADRRVDGVVEMTLEATQNYDEPLTKERLFGWHQALFPLGVPGASKIKIGAWRDDAKGPMQVISGAIGHERVHYEAPAARKLDSEVTAFLDWANRTGDVDPVLKAAQAHLWFVTVHPFDDGNGRIARAIADWALARSENSPQRFYSMSAQIRRQRKEYYDILENTQKGTLDVTEWMLWFLNCLDRAIAGTESSLASVFKKDQFWKTHAATALNERQRLMLNKLLDGFEGKMTSSKWAALTKCSHDTAQRDIVDLINQGILVKDKAGGRSTSYSLKTTPAP
ncbi:MAG: Fic family protein [Elusimicrobia bacterium]|nr:Fic family protein [Elusimicrobiota bacterium]